MSLIINKGEDLLTVINKVIKKINENKNKEQKYVQSFIARKLDTFTVMH